MNYIRQAGRWLCSYIRANPRVWLALYFAVFGAMFLGVEHIVTPESDYWVSRIPLDDKIPFLEGFIIPYCLWYPMLAAVGLYTMFFEPGAFRRFLYFIITGFTLSLLICLLIPNGQNLRPAVFPRQNLLTWAIAGIYRADTNTNVFPSMHVIGAFACAAAVFDCPRIRRLRVPAAALAVLISVSTVFIKQHSALDIIGGLALSLPIAAAVYHAGLRDLLKRLRRRAGIRRTLTGGAKAAAPRRKKSLPQ